MWSHLCILVKQIAHMRVSVGDAGGPPLLHQRSLLGAGVHGPTHGQASLHFQPAQAPCYFCGNVATKQSSPAANAEGFGLLKEWTGVCLQNLSGLPTGAARGHPDVSGGCVPVKTGTGCQRFLNHRLAPACWACLSVRRSVRLSFRV